MSYRNFLGTVGDLRAGPGYGLFPIRLLVHADRRSAARLPNLGELAHPFRHTADWNPLPSWIREPADAPGHEQRLYEWETWYSDRQWIDGALPISHLGCGTWALLVLNGPAANGVWIDDRASDGGIRREVDTFEDWFLSWLAEAEGVARGPERDRSIFRWWTRA